MAPVSVLLLGLIILLQVAMLLVQGGGGAGNLFGGGDEAWTLLRFGANFRPATLHGEPWRLLSSVFLHGGLLHLVVNAYALYALGRLTEQLYGSLRLWLIFLLSGIAGSASSAVWGGAARLSVGASGAIFGLLGAALTILLARRKALRPEARRPLIVNLLVVIGLNLYVGYSLKVVDNLAHLGGLGGGVVVGLLLLLERRLSSGPRPSLVLRAMAGLLALSLVSTGVAAALTTPGRTLSRMPWHTVEEQGLRLSAPAYWTRLHEPGIVLRDPLQPLLLVELGLDYLDPTRPVGAAIEKRVEILSQDLARQPSVSEVHAVASPPRGLAPAGVEQRGLELRIDREPYYQALLFRRRGEGLLELRVLLPRERLADYEAVLRRIAASIGYGNVSGPGK